MFKKLITVVATVALLAAVLPNAYARHCAVRAVAFAPPAVVVPVAVPAVVPVAVQYAVPPLVLTAPGAVSYNYAYAPVEAVGYTAPSVLAVPPTAVTVPAFAYSYGVSAYAASPVVVDRVVRVVDRADVNVNINRAFGRDINVRAGGGNDVVIRRGPLGGTRVRIGN